MQANSIGVHIDRISTESTVREGGTDHCPIFSVDQLRSFKPIFSFLNSKDRDILYLVFASGKKQKDVQDILGRSQPSLCYDIKRIRKRLKFVNYLNQVFDIFIDFVEHPNEAFSPFEIEVLVLMFYTSSFTMTSEILNKPHEPITQVKVRYSYDKCLRKMEEGDMWELYEIFMVIRANLNLVRRVYCTGPEDHRMCDVYVPQ